ncbi:MAG: hypothetical protein J3K34DRAFT_387701 [Monoraphidium minutum]|nr:MAG: hypothetical protein J3K34DRAFT_387701 [Monoraphidium minutum]
MVLSGTGMRRAAAYMQAWSPVIGRLLHRPVLAPRPSRGGGGIGGSGGGPRGRRFTAQGDSEGGGGEGGGGLWGAYNRALERAPLLTKAVTTAAISAVGNVFCQLVVEGKPGLDARRLAVFTGLGFVWVAPALHTWFAFVNRAVPATGNKGALLRMLLDQGAWAPAFIASMISLLTLIDGGRGPEVGAALRSDWGASVRANWVLWVPAQFVNFRYVAPRHQLLFANVTALAWNVWFSFLTRPKAATA